MSTTGHRSKISLIGCRHDLEYQTTVDKLIASMEKNEAPYSGRAYIRVEKKGGTIKTSKKKIDGLNDESLKILSSLEEMAHAICKKGGDPSKVKTELEVEKEI